MPPHVLALVLPQCSTATVECTLGPACALWLTRPTQVIPCLTAVPLLLYSRLN